MLLNAPVLDDPAAWKSKDVDIPSLVLEFDAKQVIEIESALKNVQTKKIETITQFDFPLPSLGPILSAHVHSKLEGGKGFALLRGLPVKKWGEEKSRLAVSFTILSFTSSFYGIFSYVWRHI